MKTVFLSLYAGLTLCAGVWPCHAQQQPAPVAANEPAAPLMLVYATKLDDSVLPRIALGLEKPALKITTFEKCVRVSTENPQLMGIAVQLRMEDTKALVAAIKALGAPDARELPHVIVWFTTPDNKALDYIGTASASGIEANLVRGVFLFEPKNEEPIVRYLDEKLHPQ